MAIDLTKIVQIDFPENQYYKEEVIPKKQIVLHHTVSGDGAAGDIDWWKQSPERVATFVVIERDGTINQCFSSKFWAHHLGVKSDFLVSKGISAIKNLELNKFSIGIELDSWGGLIKDTSNNEWYTPEWSIPLKKFIPNKKTHIPKDRVAEYPECYKGFYGFEKYTTLQLGALKDLLVYLCDKFNITRTFNKDMFDVCINALNGLNGIWSHTSFRPDKSDVHPQKELIDTLKSLSS